MPYNHIWNRNLAKKKKMVVLERNHKKDLWSRIREGIEKIKDKGKQRMKETFSEIKFTKYNQK